jgi:hypothetical protein
VDPAPGHSSIPSPDGLFELHLEVSGPADDFYGRYECLWTLRERASGRTIRRLEGSVYDDTRRFGAQSVHFSPDGLFLEVTEFTGDLKRLPIPGALGPSRLAAALGDGPAPPGDAP